MEKQKHPVPPVQKISNCERPEHPVVAEIRAIANKLLESGQQFFLLGMIFTDKGDSFLAQGTEVFNIHDPNIFSEMESRFFGESLAMGKRKVETAMLKDSDSSEDSDK